jgi:hypothetical protein
MGSGTYRGDVSSDDAFTPVLGDGRGLPAATAHTLRDDDLRVLAAFFLLRDSDGEHLWTRQTDGMVQLFLGRELIARGAAHDGTGTPRLLL